MAYLTLTFLTSQRRLAIQKTTCLTYFAIFTISQIWGLSSGDITFSEQGHGYKFAYYSAVILHYAELSVIVVLIQGVNKKSLYLIRCWYLIRNGICAIESISTQLYIMFQEQNLETDVSILMPFHIYFRYAWWLLILFDMECLTAHIAELEPNSEDINWTIFQRVNFDRLLLSECLLYFPPLSFYCFTFVYKLVLELLGNFSDPLQLFVYVLRAVIMFSMFPFLVILYNGVKQKNHAKIVIFYKFQVAFIYLVGLLGMVKGHLGRQYSHDPKTLLMLRIERLYYLVNSGILSMLLIELIIQIKHPHPEWFDLEINSRTENKMRKKFMDDNKEFFKPCKISPRDIKLLDNTKVGEGQFSYVYKGLKFPPSTIWNHISPGCLIERDPEAVVAVKVLKSLRDPGYGEALLKELQILQKLGPHEHLVRFYGCCVSTIDKEWSAVCLIMEYCELGNLRDYLRKLDRDGTGSTITLGSNHNMQRELLRIAFETCEGMKFLSQNKIVHADLASRNVLLDAKKRVKITDFGMSISLYYYQTYASSAANVFPWKWMAPESLADLKFSTKSDVWSFGVVLWEIFTLGQVPYTTLEWSSDFVQEIINGTRLDKPNLAGNEMYTVMLQCWELEPCRRPDFANLSSKLWNFYKNAS